MFSPSLRVILRLALCLTSTLVWAQGDDPTQGRPTVGVVYMHTNHLGSTTFTTDENGQLKARFVYEPYGSIYRDACLGSDDVRPKFTGKELDADTELYYFEARYYDAQSGRFVSADNQAGAAVNHPMAFHRYAYSGNNPINITDPSGRSLKDHNLPKEDAAAYGESKLGPLGLRRVNEAWDSLSASTEQTTGAGAEEALVTSPVVAEDDQTVSGDTVVNGATLPTEVVLMQTVQDAWAAYLAEYSSEITAELPVPVLLPDGSVLQAASIHSDPSQSGVVTVFSFNIGAKPGVGGDVTGSLKHHPATGAAWIEIVVGGGVGAEVQLNGVGAGVTVIGVEGKVIIPIDGLELDTENAEYSVAVVHSAQLGVLEFKLENDVTESVKNYVQSRMDRFRSIMYSDVPPSWAARGYSLEEYTNTMNYHLRDHRQIYVNGHWIWSPSSREVIGRVNRYPDSYFQSYQSHLSVQENGLNFPMQGDLPMSGNTFEQGQGANEWNDNP